MSAAFPVALALMELAIGSIFASQVFSQNYNNSNQTATKNPAGIAKSENSAAILRLRGQQ
jgi:hypothetical protein